MAINKEQIEKAINTQSFAESMKNVKSVEDIRKAFAAHGVELTEEEVIKITNDIVDSSNFEMSADQLDEVYGGNFDAFSRAVTKAVFFFPNLILSCMGLPPIG